MKVNEQLVKELSRLQEATAGSNGWSPWRYFKSLSISQPQGRKSLINE